MILFVRVCRGGVKCQRPAAAAVISGTGGPSAAMPSFVAEDHFRCGGLKIVCFSQTHSANANVHLVPVQLL